MALLQNHFTLLYYKEDTNYKLP